MEATPPAPAAAEPAAPPPGILDAAQSPAQRAGQTNGSAAARGMAELVAEMRGESAPEGDAAAAPGQEGQEPKPAAEPAEAFEFGGVKFESREKAEQNFRTLRGQFRKQADEVRAVREELARVADANRRWQEWHQSQGQGQGQPAPAAGGDGQQVAGALARLDPAHVRRLYETEGPDAMVGYVVSALDGHYGETYGRQLTELREQLSQLLPQVQPLVEQDRQTREVETFKPQAASFFQEAAALTDAAGNPLIPEFQDPVAVEQIGRFWLRAGKEFGLPLSRMLNPGLLRMAVSAYRDAVASGRLPRRGAAPEVGSSEGHGGAEQLTGGGVRRTALSDQGAGLSFDRPAGGAAPIRSLAGSEPRPRISWIQRPGV